MRATELRRVLRRLGCVEVRQSGSHLIIRCDGCLTVIPIHSRDIPARTVRAIERDLEGCLGTGWLKG
ncbi:MAG TPA: type II toxin-antitoxin system HicA family toxin [Chloroflexota bacterium]|nr:type II toxin-antitoxin system HicA family toxin [Chloroflexota bacterium]